MLYWKQLETKSFPSQFYKKGQGQMKYKLEYYPNPEVLGIHLKKRVTTKSIKIFYFPEDDIEEQPQFVKDLFRIDGIDCLSLRQFEVSLTKGTAFSWEELLPSIFEVLSVNLDSGEKMEETGKPIRYHISREGYRVENSDDL